MKEYVVKNSLCLIKKYNPTIDQISLSEIEYGLVGIYLTITKTIVILLLACILKIIPEVIIFIIVFNIIRTCSFGLHATKSWICLISSILIFIPVPIVCQYANLSNNIKFLIGIITIFFIYKNSPADTYKRPIVDPERRKIYKLLSTIITIMFTILALCINSNFLSNCFIFAPIVQCFLISPMVYKFFHLPYDNYKTYLASTNIS
ncbi:MAG: hypothetical protein HFH09_05175 [Bacilli bacterium]|jgi:accessory gene regulator B|nr:hypothetical protein [Bacilli bacterium]